ncbi:MAG TPA: cytochrome o ubiquinol oxidase subunit I [Candidatus Saccharimonadales bacterium]|nr:cytochrome o ubiquinol oxidase subunit I [Candidatus Saccharimonadales bacterium]
MLGRLTLSAFKHPAVTMGGVVMMTLGLIALVVALTYFKKWKWLWKEWLTSTDPKKIGVMYIIVAFVMLLRGISDALMLRSQQAVSAGSSHGYLSSDTFQQVFSAHGSIMIFFVAMGMVFGLLNLVVPLQIGSRDVAFPFMNNASFWLYIAGMVLMNTSLAIGDFSGAGWLAYPPLSEAQYSPGVGVDYWIWSLQIAGIGSLLSGINFIVTILKMRAPGMTLMKMPVFVWSVLGSMSLVAFAFPILTVTLALLFLDRSMGMHFFTSMAGGNAMMYVNLIWAWGHPEVYILILPAFGVFSEIVPVFSGKKLFGYTSMVWAIWAIVLLSFLVWLHHFFTMGAGADVNAFFGIMTMIIAVPTGVKVFNWLFTMYKGRIRFTTPMLWFMGFVVTFTLGGVAGVILAMPPADFQLHNSLFLVAHFHTMIIGGVVFGFFAGITYWFPKVFGFKLNERLGRYAFWCWLIGFLLAFVPLYILGLMGATRRLDHYDASLGWQQLFIVAALGVALIGLGTGFQILQFVVSIWKRKDNMDTTGDPWDGRTLEWSTASPAPVYNFAVIPEVTTRDAFWEMKKNKTAETAAKAPHYEPITLPKNTPSGVFVGAASFAFGFGMVWHMWWLAIVALLAAITALIIRLNNEDTEFTLSPAQITEIETSTGDHGRLYL